MDTRRGTGEARPYPLRPRGEVEAWEEEEEEVEVVVEAAVEEEEEEEGALWGEVRARVWLVGALEAPTRRAIPSVAPKSTATPVDKEDGGPSAPAPTGSGTTR